MKFGICQLPVIPLREEPDDTSEMVTQCLFGECFTVLKTKKKWAFIRLELDNYEGWVSKNQILEIDALPPQTKTIYSAELIDYITLPNGQLMSIPLGSLVNNRPEDSSFEGQTFQAKLPAEVLINTALLFLNTAYLWGCKTAFGIDCSGFTQQVYRVCGYSIPRDAKDQAMLGDTLSFVEESTAGDLAFFDNEEGQIIHVGILLGNNRIIHAHGQVRIDMIDQTGIFNSEKGKHTHTLRVIKKII